MRKVKQVKPTNCDRCNAKFVQDGVGTGYGRFGDETLCYDCMDKQTIEDMKRTGERVLYLSGDEVINWTGTIRFKVLSKNQSPHTAFGHPSTRRHVTFFGPDGKHWYGDQYGSWSELCYCKRYKNQ